MNRRLFCLLITVLVLRAISAVAQLPDSVEGKIDALARSFSVNALNQEYFLQMEPEVVPVVTKKLIESLGLPVSPDASRVDKLMDLSREERTFCEHQMGLISMEKLALTKMPLNPAVRNASIGALVASLKSPYFISRDFGMSALAEGLGRDAIDLLLPSLGDSKDYNAAYAIGYLEQIGDAETATKIGKFLDARREGLTATQISNDLRFAYGTSAIERMRKKTSSPGTLPSRNENPNKTPALSVPPLPQPKQWRPTPSVNTPKAEQPKNHARSFGLWALVFAIALVALWMAWRTISKSRQGGGRR